MTVLIIITIIQVLRSYKPKPYWNFKFLSCLNYKDVGYLNRDFAVLPNSYLRMGIWGKLERMVFANKSTAY